MPRTLPLAALLLLALASPAGAAYLRLTGGGDLPLGRDALVQLQLLNGGESGTFRSLDFAISVDASRLAFDAFLFPGANGFTLASLAINRPADPAVEGALGSITGRIEATSPAGIPIVSGVTLLTLLNIVVASPGTRFGGDADVNLMASFAGVTTRLNDGATALSPAPTDGYTGSGVNRDARFVVTPVPEPGAIVLAGVGLGVAWMVRRRR